MDSRLARWIALFVFAVLIVGWVLAAVHLTAASAGRPNSPLSLRSNLAADYATDGGEKISSLRISIVADFLRDLGLPVDSGSLLNDLDSPVPTATALNFAGDPPFTPTALPTQIQSETPPPTPTATNTARPLPTKTPEPTKTDNPKDTPVPGDEDPPILSGGSLSPSPGALGSCTEGISITGLHVVDEGPSSGIAWVKLKYKILGPGSKGYKYSDDLGPQVSGGWTEGEGSTWDAYYDGSVTIDFDTGYAAVSSAGRVLFLSRFAVVPTSTPTPELPTATPTSPAPTNTPAPTSTPAPFEVEVWSITRDNAGNETFKFHGSYTMPGSCAD